VNRIKTIQREIHGISLVKLEWVVRLGVDVHANDLKTSEVVTVAGTTTTTKQVKKTWLITHQFP